MSPSSAAATPPWMLPRVAKRGGAASVTLVSRRTRRFMPADAQELELAMQDGVDFLELAAPVKQENGVLTCEKMRLGEPDASGRRSPVPTGETVELPCDLVISAVGEQVEEQVFYGQRHHAQREGPSCLLHERSRRLCCR